MRTEKELATYAYEEEDTPCSRQLSARVNWHLAKQFKIVCKQHGWTEAQAIRAGIMKMVDDYGEGLKKYA